MKKKLGQFIAKYYYPQYYFSKKINKSLKGNTNGVIIIDAPCGIGQTTYWLAKENGKAYVYGYDISSTDILTAQSQFKLPNLNFKAIDIFEIKNSHNSVDYFCLINSLFLLPQPKELLKSIYSLLQKNGKLLLIIPNIEGDNYKHFIKENPLVNQLEISRKEIVPYFSELGYQIDFVKDVSFIPHYKSKIGKSLSFLSHFYFIVINWIYENILFKKNGNYFFIALSK